MLRYFSYGWTIYGCVPIGPCEWQERDESLSQISDQRYTRWKNRWFCLDARGNEETLCWVSERIKFSSSHHHRWWQMTTLGSSRGYREWERTDSMRVVVWVTLWRRNTESSGGQSSDMLISEATRRNIPPISEWIHTIWRCLRWTSSISEDSWRSTSFFDHVQSIKTNERDEEKSSWRDSWYWTSDKKEAPYSRMINRCYSQSSWRSNRSDRQQITKRCPYWAWCLGGWREMIKGGCRMIECNSPSRKIVFPLIDGASGSGISSSLEGCWKRGWIIFLYSVISNHREISDSS